MRSTTPQPNPGPPVQLCPAGTAIARHVQLRRRCFSLAQPLTRQQKQPGWAAADPAPLGAVWHICGTAMAHQPIRAPSPPPVSCLSGGSWPLAETARREDHQRTLPDPGCYEERYRLTGRAALGLAAGLLSVGLGILWHTPVIFTAIALLVADPSRDRAWPPYDRFPLRPCGHHPRRHAGQTDVPPRPGCVRPLGRRRADHPLPGLPARAGLVRLGPMHRSPAP